MAAFQPTDQDIDTFLSMVPDLNRSQNNNNNVDQAVNEYFDNLHAPNKYEWDEAPFEADRNGMSTTHGPEFNIQAPDDTGPYVGRFDGGPSRPPSRISNSKFSRADAQSSLSYDQGDRDLHEALAASRAEAGLPPQESGITSTDQVFFGPANRSQYEPGKWELIRMGNSSTQDIILQDPSPAERKRDVNTPAFLKPSIDDHRLGALLTIYHEIPLVREIFLDRKNVLPSYGSHNEWWTGRAIELPTTNEPDDIRYQVGQEMQRLMAFLDKTDRSYGSADALASLPAVKEQHRKFGECVEVSVMRAYHNLLGDSDSAGAISKLFSIGVGGTNQADSEEFCILRFELPQKDSDQETFYDVADAALWHLDPLDLSNSSFLSHIADVVAFQLVGDPFSKGIEIPYIWYPDRYLESSRQAALNMRLQKADIKEKLRRIDAQQEQLTNYTMLGNSKVKVKDLFKAVLQHDLDEIKEDGAVNPTSDSAAERLSSGAKSNKLSAEVHKLMNSIDQKLMALNEEKEKARDTLRELSKLYTEPSEDPAQPVLHRYTLRGISISKSIMYISTQAEPDLIDMDLNRDQTKSNGDQWWRISYSTSGSTPFSVDKTTLEEALEAARNYKAEDGGFIVVYASDKAMTWERKPLPKALETFVRYDNALFKSEFSSDFASQISPGKRKFDSSSEDSPNSGRWGSTGSVRGEGGVNILEREIGGSEPEDGERRGSEQPEVIVGIDPFVDGGSEGSSRGQEMQERKSMRMLPSRARGGAEARNPIDNMDLDRVVEDSHVAEESGAVKNIGLS
ncbi:hypothetical protein OIDMADRAFT_184043 [Oidiodendron maius Zn]|uniref:Ubiquitin interaction motif protein n=1 Tax=Oidiodendron maius (strain Zn) TaxID=913774 RepID=A0A0C3GFM6_OIDMZ|nr:hypothetical protein OIDMADRAFT_184043 [Oidiodendron maius Zn]